MQFKRRIIAMSIRPAWWMTLQAFFYPFVLKLLQDTQRTLPGKLSGRISVPLLSGKNFHITYLPINKRINGIGESVVPKKLLEQVIRESSHRALIKRCTCRDGNKCQNHPIELGCLLLGDGAGEIDTGVARHVGVSEALEHVNDCIDEGLVPFVGRFKADDYLWGVRDRGKLLTVCFCCRCCCMIKNTLKHLPPISHDSLIKLKGLEIKTDDQACNQCGVCVSECFMDARSLEANRILYDTHRCKGCGRCLTVCPENAISADVVNIDEAVADVLGRVRTRIDYT
jgi:ferredoxin